MAGNVSLGNGLFNLRGAITVALGICALCHSVISLYFLSSQPERVLSTGFGTARAPYSDALGPWLLGGLHAFFGVQQIDYLYRPTIGWFWGSIIALTHRVYFIPLVFFGAWVLIIFTFLMLWRNTNLGLTLSLWIGWLAISFDNSFLPLSPMSLTVDLASFVLTALGVLLIILGAEGKKLLTLPCLVGGGVLGIAAAIRGPMILGGLVFIFCILGIYRKNDLKMIVITSIAFLSPIVLDVVMQNFYHVYNNGLISLFCLYSDITHAWNGECHRRFLELRPGLGSVIVDYLNFVSSGSGFSVLLGGLLGRVERDSDVFSTKVWASLLLILSLYNGWKIWKTIKIKDGRTKDLRVHIASIWSLFVFWTFFLAARYSSTSKAVLALFLVSACCIIAVKYKLSLPFSLILSYSTACVFLTSLGLWAYDRVALTFSFLLHLGALLLITQSFETTGELKDEANPRAVAALSWLVIIMFAGLYTCWAWWPNDLRSQYVAKIDGRKMAVKISDDKMLNRSLYFTGGHVLVYTNADELMIGSIRPYSDFVYPSRFWNESFIHPNAFLEK